VPVHRLINNRRAREDRMNPHLAIFFTGGTISMHIDPRTGDVCAGPFRR
jgi:L-asparaginase/Glu-tRNA(Gln) amidotransferase subunit D